jgi:hypothetical protein
MAPNTLARSRLAQAVGWAHPYSINAWSPMFYADGGDGEPADGDAEADDETDTGTDDGWVPPTRDEWENHQTRLRTASAEAAARRKYLKAHGIDPKTGQKAADDTEPADDTARPRAGQDDEPRGASPAEVKRAVERAAAEAEIRGLRKTKSLVTSLNDGLAVAGWNGQRLGLLMKLIDLDDVEIDDDGEVTGLAEQIEVAKREFPEAFKRTRNPAGTSNAAGGSGQNGAGGAKVDTADKPAPKAEPKGWAEQVAARALRGKD